MTNKSTRKSLKTSGLALLVCIVMLIGTTFAWFTDSITNSGNKIEAGSLDIDLVQLGATLSEAQKEAIDEAVEDSIFYSIGAVEVPVFNYDKWEPGYTDVKVLGVQNKGTLALKFRLDIVAQGDLGKLADVIDVYVKNSEEAITTVPSSFADITVAESGYKNAGTLSSLMNDEDGVAYGQLTEGKSSYVAIALHMQESADNNYQGETIAETFDIALNATQLNSEEDGFGNPDYDEDANPDAVFGADKIKDAMSDPNVKEVVVGENIDLNKDEFKASNGNCTFEVQDNKTLNLNGNDFIRPDGGSGSGLVVKTGSTATIENGNVISEGDSTTVDLAEGSTTTFKDVHFKGHGNTLIKARAKSGTTTTIVFRNCTFENAPVNISGRDGATLVDVKFENCTFEGSYKMYGADGKPLADKLGYIHYTNYFVDVHNSVYGNVSFDKCTMNFDASESSSKKAVIGGSFGLGCSEDENITLNVNDVTITGSNIIPILVDNRWDETVTIIETGNTTYTVDGQSVNYDGSKK